jgi:hypothetical protein
MSGIRRMVAPLFAVVVLTGRTRRGQGLISAPVSRPPRSVDRFARLLGRGRSERAPFALILTVAGALAVVVAVIVGVAYLLQQVV